MKKNFSIISALMVTFVLLFSSMAPVIPVHAAGEQASFVRLDGDIKGDWLYSFGKDGWIFPDFKGSYMVEAGKDYKQKMVLKVPSFLQFSLQVGGANCITAFGQNGNAGVDASDTNPHQMLRILVGDPGGLDDGWKAEQFIRYGGTGTSNFFFNFTDANEHIVALYWCDNPAAQVGTRGNKIVHWFVSGTTTDLCTPVTIEDKAGKGGMHDGVWAIYKIKGNVTLGIEGTNVMLAGVLLGDAYKVKTASSSSTSQSSSTSTTNSSSKSTVSTSSKNATSTTASNVSSNVNNSSSNISNSSTSGVSSEDIVITQATTDSNITVRVVLPSNMDPKTKLIAADVTDGENYTNALTALNNQTKKFKVINTALYDVVDTETSAPSGTKLDIQISLPTGYDVNKTKVLRLESDKSVTDMNAKINAEGNLAFTSERMGNFIIAEVDSNFKSNSKTPTTTKNNTLMIIIVVAAALVGILILLALLTNMGVLNISFLKLKKNRKMH